jgi:hypothetical protein
MKQLKQKQGPASGMLFSVQMRICIEDEQVISLEGSYVWMMCRNRQERWGRSETNN